MKNILIILYLLLLIILSSCKKDSSNIIGQYELSNAILGNWIFINTDKTISDYDSTFGIQYTFKDDNEFERSYFLAKYQEKMDTLFFERGNFIKISDGLIALQIHFIDNGENIDTTHIINDTLIYFFSNEQLKISNGAKHYRQLSGVKGKLFNSTFYIRTSSPSIEYKFLHRKYFFRQDSLFDYYKYSNNKEMPSNWIFYKRYKITITDNIIYIFYDNSNDPYKSIYVFYNSNFYWGQRPLTFNKVN